MNRPTPNSSRPAMTNTPTPIRRADGVTALPSPLGPHERLHERIRVAIELLDAAARDDASLVQDREVVADHARARDVVRDDDERRPGLFGLDEQIVDFAGRDRIEPRARL